MWRSWSQKGGYNLAAWIRNWWISYVLSETEETNKYHVRYWSLNPFFEVALKSLYCLCGFLQKSQNSLSGRWQNVCSVNLTNWCFCTPAKHHCFMYFSIKGRSAALLLLSPAGPFNVSKNLHLFNLSIPLNNHNYFRNPCWTYCFVDFHFNSFATNRVLVIKPRIRQFLAKWRPVYWCSWKNV